MLRICLSGSSIARLHPTDAVRWGNKVINQTSWLEGLHAGCFTAPECFTEWLSSLPIALQCFNDWISFPLTPGRSMYCPTCRDRWSKRKGRRELEEQRQRGGGESRSRLCLTYYNILSAGMFYVGLHTYLTKCWNYSSVLLFLCLIL